MQNSKTRTLVSCAILVALATALSFVKIWTMPLGGSVTLLSMLPICLISIVFGLKWGIGSAFVYAFIQTGLDIGPMMSWGLTAKLWIGALVFDYLIAFTALGFAGVFAKKGIVGICSGVALALTIRFVSHVISGTIFFDIFMPEEWSNPFIYSIVYNGTFMLPELIATVIATPFIITALKKALPEKNL